MKNPVLIFQEEPEEVEGSDLSICLKEFEDGVEVRKMHCDHQFHSSCVDQWVASGRGHQSCPICRHPIV
uniref:RING-type domain-containing protein n=1 Tax=Kalanchoe fedtschenkoi TaxID=63787 RepID=A0A7N0TNH0_KALFE